MRCYIGSLLQTVTSLGKCGRCFALVAAPIGAQKLVHRIPNYSLNLISSISQLSNTDITIQPTETVGDNDTLRRLRRPRLECPENMIMYSDSKIM